MSPERINKKGNIYHYNVSERAKSGKAKSNQKVFSIFPWFSWIIPKENESALRFSLDFRGLYQKKTKAIIFLTILLRYATAPARASLLTNAASSATYRDPVEDSTFSRGRSTIFLLSFRGVIVFPRRKWPQYFIWRKREMIKVDRKIFCLPSKLFLSLSVQLDSLFSIKILKCLWDAVCVLGIANFYKSFFLFVQKESGILFWHD